MYVTISSLNAVMVIYDYMYLSYKQISFNKRDESISQFRVMTTCK